MPLTPVRPPPTHHLRASVLGPTLWHSSGKTHHQLEKGVSVRHRVQRLGGITWHVVVYKLPANLLLPTTCRACS
jgi:hypothetical protein